FYILCNNKSYKDPSGFVRAEALSSYFEDRKGYREGKKLLSDKSVFPSLTYHLQSAQFITNVRGEQYEHIEYTPYGELWIEETAPGIDKLPFRFTGKELDEETGLYYYGARYLDPKYSRWLSGDPALNEYIPKAPIDDEAKKHNENLPGMGGVYNTVNLHVYHYAGNNPIKYTDPDGRFIFMFG
ncbi:RHS repeat domain-containing protein, partial [Treponema pedis]|uniref:RHS repeat domain-containing protein n=1 Tax=Treponema pedis TaxID=409322 RepID=UPI0004641F86